MTIYKKDKQYKKFCAYGFLKNLRFFDAFLILFFLDKGLSYTQIGVLYALKEVAINIFEIPSGLTADTLGRKRSLIFALIAYIISFVIFYFGQGFYLFLGAMLLYGIGDAFRSGTNKGMIMDYLRMNGWLDQKVDYYGHTRSWSQKGSAISSLLAGLIVFYMGNYQSIFLVALLPYLLNLYNIWSYPDNLNFSSKSTKEERSFLSTWRNFGVHVKNRNVLRIMNSSAMHSAFMSAVKDYIQPLMFQVALLVPLFIDFNETKKTSLIIGIIYFGIYLMTSVASRKAGTLLKVGGSNMAFKTLLLGLLSGIICGVFYFFDIYWIALLFFVVIYLVESSRKPILTGMMADQVPGDILTSVLSAQSLLKSLLTILLSLGFGIIADYLSVGVAMGVISTVLILFTVVLNFTSTTRHTKLE